jgi:hypothetical protein
VVFVLGDEATAGDDAGDVGHAVENSVCQEAAKRRVSIGSSKLGLLDTYAINP